jgi:hypothetical protein
MPELAEEDGSHLDLEFLIEEVKKAKASAKTSSAPGPTGQTIALYKFIFL